MDERATYLWAKRGERCEGEWHPLILHMLDVAACAEAVLAREPETARLRLSEGLGLEWSEASPWLFLVVACHDLGKACPGFQCKWPSAPQSRLPMPASPNTAINHGEVSQIALAEFLREKGWAVELAELVADAVGSHHGNRASPINLYRLGGDRRALGCDSWTEVRRNLAEALTKVFAPSLIPSKWDLSGPDFMLLAGLTSFVDWIGSNEHWFPYGTPEDCGDLQKWFRQSHASAERALDAIGWETRTPLCPDKRTFEQVFGLTPRPLQCAVEEALDGLNEPAVLLLEAPMGEGKTEAAFFVHLELQRRFGHRGLYMALPTRATGNAMFDRVIGFLHGCAQNRKIDLQLLHGAALLNDNFRLLALSGIHDVRTGGEIRAAEWFTQKKRALLSEYGVGTVDQVLLPILPVRHNFVRLWGLANRVVIFDEIHAYDAYTGTLLVYLLRWLLALGSSVVLLSATLPPSVRRKLSTLVEAEMPQAEAQYPRLTLFKKGFVRQMSFDADPVRSLVLRVEGIPPDLAGMRSAMEAHLASGGLGMILVNTVQRAQELYRLFPEGEALERQGQRVGKRLPDSTEIFLFHARFPVNRRQDRENQALEVFGDAGFRLGRKILIATQVAEQSLDLDFDCIATDLAPIDLLLQRAGRLWRHMREFRPVAEPVLLVAGLTQEVPPSFGDPLWWNAVYSEDILLLTWALLRNRRNISLPEEIDTLVEAVYEAQVEVPESIREQLNKAIESAEGRSIAHRTLAGAAIIGLPDDASWNDPGRFVLYDEDEPGVHRTLMAQTRLGEDSVVAVPLWAQDGFHYEEVPDIPRGKAWSLRAVPVSRKEIVMKLKNLGVPAGWKKSPLLRNRFPLHLDSHGRWTENAMVRLDEDLGLVYERKEAE